MRCISLRNIWRLFTQRRSQLAFGRRSRLPRRRRRAAPWLRTWVNVAETMALVCDMAWFHCTLHNRCHSRGCALERARRLRISDGRDGSFITLEILMRLLVFFGLLLMHRRGGVDGINRAQAIALWRKAAGENAKALLETRLVMQPVPYKCQPGCRKAL
jgi:hypothetical protein